jgi:hypothetical protein
MAAGVTLRITITAGKTSFGAALLCTKLVIVT